MTPGLRVVAALKAAGFEISRPFSPSPGTMEIVQIIESASGIHEIANEFEKFIIATDKWNSAVETIIGRQPQTGIGLDAGRMLIQKARGKE